MICNDHSGYITQLKQQNPKKQYYSAAYHHNVNVLTSNIIFLIFLRF